MATEPISGADIVIKALIDQGVEVIFGYPGGAVLPLYDALFKQNQIRHILVRHEQAAVHAAEGYARTTGKVGVVLVTSGPGVSNTLTGLLDAMSDSVPILCISGQVATGVIGTQAFQECDALGLSRPVTKWNTQIRTPGEIERAVRDAFAIATQGRPGPVLIDFPKDLQRMREAAPALPPPSAKRSLAPATLPRRRLAEAAALIRAARRPVFYGGGG